MGIDFDKLAYFAKAQIKKWVVMFVNNNEDQLVVTKKLCLDVRDLEEETFSLRVKQYILVPPMKYYIEYWLKRTLNEIINLKKVLE